MKIAKDYSNVPTIYYKPDNASVFLGQFRIIKADSLLEYQYSMSKAGKNVGAGIEFQLRS